MLILSASAQLWNIYLVGDECDDPDPVQGTFPKQCPGPPTALLGLVLDIWRGALQGPGLTLTTVDRIGAKVLAFLFVAIMIVMPVATLALLSCVWVLPLRSHTRRRMLWGAMLCQSWNCQVGSCSPANHSRLCRRRRRRRQDSVGLLLLFPAALLLATSLALLPQFCR